MYCVFLEEKNTMNFRILNSPILEPYNKKTVWNNKIYARYMLLQNLDTLEENSLSNLCKERKTELWIEKALLCIFLIQALKISGLGLKVISNT